MRVRFFGISPASEDPAQDARNRTCCRAVVGLVAAPTHAAAEKFTLVRVLSPGTGCPEQLWLPLHPWKCPRPGGTGFGTAWDSGNFPGHGRGGVG